MSSHNSIPVPMGPESSGSSGSSGPRRRRRKQWRPKGRPSTVRRRALRAARRLEATVREIAADPKLRQKVLNIAATMPTPAAHMRDDSEATSRGPTEAKSDVSRHVAEEKRRYPKGAINDARRYPVGTVSAEVAADLVDRCRTPGERRAAAILGAEMWRKQVTRVVTSIADRVEGMANMASNELAELGRKFQELTTRVASLEAAAALDAPQRERLSRRWAEIEALTRRARTSARKTGSLASLRRQLAELTKFRNALLMRQGVTRSRRVNRKNRKTHKSGKAKS